MAGLATDSDPDVLAIGAGPTGAGAAKRFVEAGMRVVVLEQGRLVGLLEGARESS
jgi:choline dehydrogenase-like flavoprotein